ncbi:hypothetical protein SAMN05920897_108120 [Alkalispirochaeta americana]|uniref:Uncharacterized protein n=1 Tax=Alkalispirochaeta americana TaxID=159291 RepID=A0A1N6SKE0_9SPIO|nr:hypothetical protein [Alkalispirochaeta americana]SIQ41529.1 hypothetical protein SAMN05920897_108120 [Alkalispirochaeta americana]
MITDERLNQENRQVESIICHVLKWGLFALLLYRWILLRQNLLETLDLFLLWAGSGLAEFFLMASRGIPLTYPVQTSRREQIFFLGVAPLAAAAIAVASLFPLGAYQGILHSLGIFGVTYLIVVILFSSYVSITRLWEKRHIQDDQP